MRQASDVVDIVKEWRDPETGYMCQVVRITLRVDMTWLCGYVEVPARHPWSNITSENDKRALTINIHGGLTFVERSETGTMFGFDHNHYPSDSKTTTVDDVIQECRVLCGQLALVEIKKGA